MSLFSFPELKRKADALRIHERNLFSKTASQVLVESNESFSTSDSYDIFLSHSFKDAHFVLALKMELEAMGYSTYVDWLNDKQLDRSKVSKETANLLRRRMQTSKSLLLVSTENAHLSNWVPWELGYFDGFNDKVAILPLIESELPGDTYYGQEYLGLYPYITKAANRAGKEKLWVHDNATWYVVFDSWLDGSKPYKRN